MAVRIWVRAMILAGAVLAATPVCAQVNVKEPDPAAWLRQIYDLYRRAEKQPALQTQATFALVAKRASKSLAALFAKNDACEARQQGVCALDWDFVVDGQDFQLSRLKIGETAIAGDTATVRVEFSNFGAPCLNIYRFVREDGAWKVEDIDTKRGKDASISIAKLLGDYDYTQ